MASSYLILYACYTVPDFSFLIRRNCKWYSSEIHISCLKVCIGNLSYPFTRRKSMLFQTQGNKDFQLSMKFTPRDWLFFLPYSSHIDTEMTASRFFFSDRHIPYDCSNNLVCKACFSLLHDSSSSLLWNNTSRSIRKS